VDPLLQAALAPVLRDIASTDAPMPLIDPPNKRSMPDDPPHVWAGFWGVDGTAAGVGINLTDPEVRRVVTAADHAQDWMIHELGLHRLLPTNWPVCPRHSTTHPLTPIERDNAAVWLCPLDDVVIAPIGSLGP
jgi:hypothetical protein